MAGNMYSNDGFMGYMRIIFVCYDDYNVRNNFCKQNKVFNKQWFS